MRQKHTDFGKGERWAVGVAAALLIAIMSLGLWSATAEGTIPSDESWVAMPRGHDFSTPQLVEIQGVRCVIWGSTTDRNNPRALSCDWEKAR